jgi:heme/copper-type cytochrome/quinol oxidase subunit 2
MTALIIAQQHSDSQGSYDWIWIVAAALFVVIVAVGLMTVFHKSTSASRGGVQHPEGERRRGNPPFESIER